jgi:hypothetical protein
MNEQTAVLADLADAEFDGRSFNGPSLMKTLESLSPEDAAFKGTYEGYSAWELALHCAYYKYFVARSLGAAGPIEPYPFEKGSNGFGSTPEKPSPSAWESVLEYLRASHKAVWAQARALPPDRLEGIMEEWKVPYRAALAWLAGHDVYHVAQLRSMGVPGIKESG